MAARAGSRTTSPARRPRPPGCQTLRNPSDHASRPRDAAVRSTADTRPAQAGNPAPACSMAAARTASRGSRPQRACASAQERTAPGTEIPRGPRSGIRSRPRSRSACAEAAAGARPEPLSATCSPAASSHTSQNASPPIPQPLGMTTPRTALVAIAASTAWPPAASTARPADVARWWGATTAPRRHARPSPDRPRDGPDRQPSAVPVAPRPPIRAGPGADPVLMPPQRRERQERHPEEHERREEDPVEPGPLRRLAADEAAEDLAKAQEHRVQAHDRAAVVGVGLGHVGEQADRRGRRPREDEQAGATDDDQQQQHHGVRPGRVVDRREGREHHGPADDAVQDDRGPPQRPELAAPVEQAREEQQPAGGQRRRDLDRVEAAHQLLVRERGIRCPDHLEQRLAGVQAERRVDGDPGRRQEPDVAATQDPHVPPEALLGVVGPARGLGLRVPGHAEPVDQERRRRRRGR